MNRYKQDRIHEELKRLKKREGLNALSINVEKVQEWSRIRMLEDGNPDKQALKLVSEVGELCDSLAKHDQNGIIDGIGDTLVVIIILCEQLGLELNKCLEYAYNEIKDRKGLTIDGVFIKLQDLTVEQLQIFKERNNE